jgi:hypothetical protein
MEITLYHKVTQGLLSSIPGRNHKEKIIALADLLKLTEVAVYNKFNGRSRLTLEECVTICSRWQISFDNLVNISVIDPSFVPFYADGIKYNPRNFSEYLYKINQYYAKIRTLDQVHGYFLANEVPIYHILPFPNLLYMKFYIWNEFNWRIPELTNHYDPRVATKNHEFLTESKLSYDLFCSFDSTEIWNPHILDNTITQFENLIKLGVITSEIDIKNFKLEMYQLLDLLLSYTQTGTKQTNSKDRTYKTNIYVTDLNLGSEIILVKTKEIDFLFQQIDIPNYIRSTDKKMTQKVYESIKCKLKS